MLSNIKTNFQLLEKLTFGCPYFHHPEQLDQLFSNIATSTQLRSLDLTDISYTPPNPLTTPLTTTTTSNPTTTNSHPPQYYYVTKLAQILQTSPYLTDLKIVIKPATVSHTYVPIDQLIEVLEILKGKDMDRIWLTF